MNNLESKAKAWEEILQHVLDKDSGRYYSLVMDLRMTPVEAVIGVLENAREDTDKE